MKVLLLSNMYPSKVKPYAGIFVKNQYECLSELLPPNSMDIFYMRRTFTSKWGSVLKYLRASITFIPYLLKKYDVVHLHFFYPLIYLVWIYKKLHPKTKVVVTFHGRDITTLINDSNQAKFQKIAKIVDFSIPVGNEISSLVESKLQLKTGLILPVGVNHNVFYQEDNVKAKLYDFIWIGSFIHRKGIDTVIEALKGIKNDKISYCFCGSGEYLGKLKELKKNHNITLKQNQTQNQLRKLLNESRFFFIMSRSEGFLTATIEAMYCGVPILTSDIPQFKEQVLENKNGFMVPLEDSEKLKNKILELSEVSPEEYDRLSQGALSSFRELSLENVCKLLIRTYKELTE